MSAFFHVNRAADLMRRCDLDAIVATSPVNVTYLSQYDNPLDGATKEYMLTPGAGSDRALLTFAIAPLEGALALVIPAMFAVGARGRGATVYPVGRADLDHDHACGLAADDAELAEALRVERWRSPVEALAAALRDRGLGNARIGLETDGLAAGLRARLAEATPAADIRDCTNLFRLLRAVKTEGELELLRRAATVSESAAAAALVDARPGMSLDTVARSFRSHVADQGADLDHFAVGPRGLGIAMRSTHTLSADDVLYVDYGCVLQSVHSDSGVTLALATPTTDLLTRYNVLRTSVERGATTLRAGLPASAVWRAMHDAVDTVNGMVSSPHGHGLGLETREYPLIVPDSGLRIRDDCIDESADLELELGMVVNLEASTFIPGVASLHVERSYVVGAAAGSPLIAQERDRPIVPGADRPQAPVHDLVHLETRPG